MGRPSKRTPEREARILEALSAGNTRKAACHYAGIGVQTLDDWQSRFRDFREAVEKAEGDAEVRAVATIVKAAQDGTWQAAAWWLERRRSEDYARRDKVDLEVYHHVRQEAERLAYELGMPVDEFLRQTGVSIPLPQN